MKNITATDRKALIRLASSLPKGSEERKTILAGLSKATDFGPFKPSDKVEVELSGRRVSILKGKSMTVAQAIGLDSFLHKMYEATGEDSGGRGNKFRELESAKREVETLQAEVKLLEKELDPLIKEAKKLGVLDHYVNGGDNMIEVYFEGPDGETYRIMEGDVEMV